MSTPVKTNVYIDAFNLYQDFWTVIRESHLKRSLFPRALNDAQGTFHKPKSW